MAFAVFVHRADSIYEDSPASQYQFPPQYLSRAQQCVGDWIVYYEPRKVPTSRGYYAVARVAEVVPDPGTAGMYLALIEPGSYLELPDPVPFIVEDGIAESGLLNERGRISGRAQAAVRGLSAHDFGRILARGIAESELLLPRDGGVADSPVLAAQDHPQAPLLAVDVRERIQLVSNRLVRKRAFRKVVLRAYDERCAVTGLKLINGGGRAEVDAAHIRPVEANGPDIVNNGLALSGTAHWMFDRGLIGIGDDLEIIVSRHVNDREGVAALINGTGRLIGPLAGRDRPHPVFLSWHRENCFKL